MVHSRSHRVPGFALIAGAVAGMAAGAAALNALRLFRRIHRAADATTLDALEDAAVDLLRRDRQTGVCAIDVAALAPGIIELTGAVPSTQIAQHAARLLHGLPGMHTVISRLEVGSLEERLAANRERLANGDPRSLERRWYGVRVGTGRRRQSVATDPDRPDDSVKSRARELEVDTAELPEPPAPRPGHRSDDGHTRL